MNKKSIKIQQFTKNKIKTIKDVSVEIKELYTNTNHTIKSKKIIEESFDSNLLPQKFIIPNQFVEIGDRAFMDAFFNKVFIIPSSIKKIGREAFSGSSFSGGLVVLSSIKDIDSGAFDFISLPKTFKTKD